jgi:hypothetical protein
MAIIPNLLKQMQMPKNAFEGIACPAPESNGVIPHSFRESRYAPWDFVVGCCKVG